MDLTGKLPSEYPDPTHPEFVAAWELAKRIGQMWLAKLEQDFPERRFRVYVSRHDDPIIHFHQVRPGEQPWLSDAEGEAQLARDELAIYESGHPEPLPAS